ncbi:MAG: hypothetical protein V3V18_05595 [Methylococcales bacterium]
MLIFVKKVFDLNFKRVLMPHNAYHLLRFYEGLDVHKAPENRTGRKAIAYLRTFHD